jgi:hypothetical protein
MSAAISCTNSPLSIHSYRIHYYIGDAKQSTVHPIRNNDIFYVVCNANESLWSVNTNVAEVVKHFNTISCD